jgi:hypothetical protein
MSAQEIQELKNLLQESRKVISDLKRENQELRTWVEKKKARYYEVPVHSHPMPILESVPSIKEEKNPEDVIPLEFPDTMMDVFEWEEEEKKKKKEESQEMQAIVPPSSSIESFHRLGEGRSSEDPTWIAVKRIKSFATMGIKSNMVINKYQRLVSKSPYLASISHLIFYANVGVYVDVIAFVLEKENVHRKNCAWTELKIMVPPDFYRNDEVYEVESRSCINLKLYGEIGMKFNEVYPNAVGMVFYFKNLRLYMHKMDDFKCLTSVDGKVNSKRETTWYKL